MRIFKLVFLAVCLFAFGQSATAQNYSSAIGLRLGYPLSLSYKTFISETNAIEGYVGFRGFSNYNWISLNGAYQIHNEIGVDGLEWYYGAGAGVQFWSFDFDADGITTFSVSGYLGLQYTFEDIPVSISADWVPTYFVGSDIGFGIGVRGFGGGYGALAARYTLGR